MISTILPVSSSKTSKKWTLHRSWIYSIFRPISVRVMTHEHLLAEADGGAMITLVMFGRWMWRSVSCVKKSRTHQGRRIYLDPPWCPDIIWETMIDLINNLSCRRTLSLFRLRLGLSHCGALLLLKTVGIIIKLKQLNIQIKDLIAGLFWSVDMQGSPNWPASRPTVSMIYLR